MKRANGVSHSSSAATGRMMWGGSSTPDRRLASLFTKRSLTEPAKATSVGIVSTYPPTRCGIAAFTASLTDALLAGTPGMSVGIFRIGSGEHSAPDPRVVHHLSGDSMADSRAAARLLNKFDVAFIQHDYGIYGGDDGDQVLDILGWLLIPVVLVVHTVLSKPTPHQRSVMEKLTESADAIVTMSHSGRSRLIDDYRVEPRKIMLIPHGTSVANEVVRVARQAPRPMVLTWGLLGPGKGIEWGIDALSAMSDRLRPRYVVAGQTHPRVLATEGENYRDSLVRRAASQGVGDLVEFEPGFVSPQRLRELLGEADVVLLPFDSDEQVTSGVLTEALASMVPVVSTGFPHAVDLLGDGRGGILVPHKEPAAIAAALTKILVTPGVAEAMSAHNATMTSLVSWSNVAGHYRQLFNALMRRPSPPGP